MTDIFLGPKRYVQRPGAMADAGAELNAFVRLHGVGYVCNRHP